MGLDVRVRLEIGIADVVWNYVFNRLLLLLLLGEAEGVSVLMELFLTFMVNFCVLEKNICILEIVIV